VLGDVAVAGDHDLESCSFRFRIKLRQIVHHVNRNSRDLDHCCLGQLSRPGNLVDIAANRGDGRDIRELLKNLGRPNVPGMNDMVRVAQSLQSLGAKQPVRVRDDADMKCSSQLPVSSTLVSTI